MRSWRAKVNSWRLCTPLTLKTKNLSRSSTWQANRSLMYSRRQCIISTNTPLLTHSWTLRKYPLLVLPPLLHNQKNYSQPRYLTKVWKLNGVFFAVRFLAWHWNQSFNTSFWKIVRSVLFLPITSAYRSLSNAKGWFWQKCRIALLLWSLTFISGPSNTLAQSLKEPKNRWHRITGLKLPTWTMPSYFLLNWSMRSA